MTTPKVYADFQKLDDFNRLKLTCAGTIEDLQRHGIELQPGMILTFYMDDADEEGRPDEMQAEGVVDYSLAENCWVAAIDWKKVRHASDTIEAQTHGFEIPLVAMVTPPIYCILEVDDATGEKWLVAVDAPGADWVLAYRSERLAKEYVEESRNRGSRLNLKVFALHDVEQVREWLRKLPSTVTEVVFDAPYVPEYFQLVSVSDLMEELGVPQNHVARAVLRTIREPGKHLPPHRLRRVA